MTTYNIAADTDDGYWQAAGEGGAFSKTGNDRIYIGFGAPNCNGWFRFTGISGLAGETIASCVLTLKGYGPGEDSIDLAELTIKMREGTDNPSSPAAGTDLDGYDWTETGITWGLKLDGESFSSPELKTVLQELIDAGRDPSSLLIGIFHNGSGGYTVADSYSHSGGTPASLDITVATASNINTLKQTKSLLVGVG